MSRTERRVVLGNLAAALSEEPRPGAARKLSGKQEALLVATACAKPPAGRARWTLELLAGEMVKLTEHAELSRETVRRRLAENDLKPRRKNMWCIPEVDGTYVARMEDVLDLYAKSVDPKRPVVCFDESRQLIGEVRQPVPAVSGQLERYDCEYRRNGTANLFVLLEAHRPWRTVKVTDTRIAPRLRRMHARSHRSSLSQGRANPRRARQPVDPFSRCPLPDLPGARGGEPGAGRGAEAASDGRPQEAGPSAPLRAGKPAAPPKTEPDGKAQRNFSDPESRILKTRDGFI